MKKNRNKYYKKYYKKHKKEAYLKLKKWREKQKYNKISLKNAEKYGNITYEAVKEQLKLQIVNSIEASIDTINYFLEKKDVNKAQISLEWLKKESNKLLKILKGEKYW